jgi:hypothetical protein
MKDWTVEFVLSISIGEKWDVQPSAKHASNQVSARDSKNAVWKMPLQQRDTALINLWWMCASAKREREKEGSKRAACVWLKQFLLFAHYSLYVAWGSFLQDWRAFDPAATMSNTKQVALCNFSNSAGPAALAQFESGPRLWGYCAYIYLRPSPRVSALIKLFYTCTAARHARTGRSVCPKRIKRLRLS